MESTASAVARWRFTRFIARYPILFFPSINLLRRLQGQRNEPFLTRKGTELVIEGYFRSANTFAVYAFLMAQPSWVVIAHHTHAPATVISAVRRQLPVLILIREPRETLFSLALKHPGLPIEEGLRDYLDFYKRILPYHRDFVVATFKQVTDDFGLVTERLNRRFMTEYVPFEHTRENVETIFVKIQASDSVVESGDRTKYSIPMREKETKKKIIEQQLQGLRVLPLLEETQAIYECFRALS